MDAALFWIRKVAALVIFVWLVFTFRKEAREVGRSVLGWSALAVAAFYGTYALVGIGLTIGYLAIGGADWGRRLSESERLLGPYVVLGSQFVAFLAAFAVVAWLRGRLRALYGSSRSTI